MQIIVTILSDLAGRAACHPSLACSLVPSTPTATSRVLSHVCRRPAIPASGCSSARGSGPGDERAHVCRAHFDARLAQFVSFRYSFQAQQTICVQVQEGRRGFATATKLTPVHRVKNRLVCSSLLTAASACIARLLSTCSGKTSTQTLT